MEKNLENGLEKKIMIEQLSPPVKANYLRIINKIARNWLLHREEAKAELEYISKRVPVEYHKLFKFGYIPSKLPLIEEFIEDIKKTIPKDMDARNILYELKLFYFKKNKINAFFEHNNLIIPYYNVYGKLVSIVGRTLLPEEIIKQNRIPKYKNLPFKRNKNLFGLNFSLPNILEKDQVVIVEGQIDFYTSFIHGLDNSCALCGSKLSFEHVLLLKRFTNNMIFLSDNDEAGNSGWEKIIEKDYIKKCNINIQRAYIPDSSCNDIDQFFTQNPVYNPSKIISNLKKV